MWPGAAALAGAGLMVLTPPFFYSCPSAPGHSGQVAEPEFEPRVYAERARCERSEPGLFNKESSILGEHRHLGEGRQPRHRGVLATSWGLSRVPQDVRPHPWPLPTGGQQHPFPALSPSWPMSWGQGEEPHLVENHRS